MAKYILSAFADEASPALDEQIKALKEAGVCCVELRGVDGKNVKDLTIEEAEAVRAKLDAAGIAVSSMGSPFGKIGINDDFAPHFEEFKHALKLCKVLGTGLMRIFSFYIPEGEDPNEYREEVMHRLGFMLEAAEEADVRLAHENEKGIYGDIGDRCVDLLEMFGDKMGCIFDPANFIQCGDKPYEQFVKLERFITYMHVKDALFEDGSVVPCGAGDGGLQPLLDEINGTDMYLSVEPHLTVFKGLENLQNEGLKHKYTYPDSYTAFQAAVSALKDTLKNIGFTEGGNGTWIR